MDNTFCKRINYYTSMVLEDATDKNGLHPSANLELSIGGEDVSDDEEVKELLFETLEKLKEMMIQRLVSSYINQQEER